MCRQISEGTRWERCGHFQRFMAIGVMDCGSVRCKKSNAHPKSCQCTSSYCTKNFGAEVQKVVESVNDWCFPCKAAAARGKQK